MTSEQNSTLKSISKVATGIRGLDTVLKGGLPRGRTTLFSGGPGTGKTFLATEFLYRRAQAGEPGVLISFEERKDDLRINAAAMGLDTASLEQADKLRLVHAEVPHGAIRAGEFNIQGLLALIDGHTRSIGATCIVLDAVDVLMRIFADPMREREEMYILNDWLRDRAMTVILTVKTGTEGRHFHEFLDFMADCVIALDQRIQGQVRTRRLTVIKFRGTEFLSNEHPYVLSYAGVVLLPISSISLVHQPPGGVASSGNEKLDSVLGGGFLHGSCILLAGASGTGKTTLACTFALEACRHQEKVLYLDFEESEEALTAGMLSVGLDLQPAVKSGALQVLTAMPESMGVEQHLLRIIDKITEFTPNHVVLDAVSACHRMGSKDAAFGFLVRLLTACKERGLTCFYTNQVTDLEQASEISGFGISSLVDSLLLLQYVDDGRNRSRRLLVIKSRGRDHSMRYHKFSISGHGLELNLPAEEEVAT